MPQRSNQLRALKSGYFLPETVRFFPKLGSLQVIHISDPTFQKMLTQYNEQENVEGINVAGRVGNCHVSATFQAQRINQEKNNLIVSGATLAQAAFNRGLDKPNETHRWHSVGRCFNSLKTMWRWDCQRDRSLIQPLPDIPKAYLCCFR